MNYKSIITATLCLFLGYQTSQAQSLNARVGGNLSTMVAKDDVTVYSDDLKFLPGFQAGVSFNYPVLRSKLALDIEIGAQLDRKGFAQKSNTSLTLFGTTTTTDVDATSTHYYINVPINAKLGFDLNSFKPYVLGGIYVGNAIAGTQKSTVTVTTTGLIEGTSTNETQRNIEWGNDSSDDFRPLDYGVQVGLGVELKSLPINIEVAYGVGFANLAANQANGNFSANRSLSATVAYRFLQFGN